MLSELKRFVIGSPIETARQTHERLSKKVALAVFSSDALSSVAYATEEILHILVLGGIAALSLSLPVAAGIAVLLVVVSFSYRQTIKAYPHGGGSYIVAKDNLGVLPSLTAGAGLLVGYVLTVAVSLSAGVSAIVSALPQLDAYRVPMALVFVVLLTLTNLRGLRESGIIFSVPTYAFLATIFILLIVGGYRFLTGTIVPVNSTEHVVSAQAVAETIGILFIMKAFAAGCTALTGIEAISDGVPAFKKPEWVNARATLTIMAGLLTVMFLGITFLAQQYLALPPEPGNPETVLSQIGRGVFGGRGLPYSVLQAATATILILAANTAYADFPRLLSFLARDRYMPRQFASLGDRLVFSNGIIVLAVAASVLIVIFDATVTALIPLYAGGVFISFTIAQTGMVQRWRRLREAGWQRGMLINGIGAFTTFVVALIVISQKFLLGAWILMLLLPAIIAMFLAIHRHYVIAAEQLSLEGLEPPPPLRNTVIVPVSTLHRGVVNALKYAESIAPGNVIAVHVAMDEEQTAKLRAKWAKWGGTTQLVVLDSPYRSLVRPLMRYLDEIDRQWNSDMITVVLPEFVPARWWHNLLHNQTALMIKGALLFRKNRVVTSVPYRLDQ
ncbi:MAG TPA: APC family permease [Herpetosiphonaceae bacterium]